MIYKKKKVYLKIGAPRAMREELEPEVADAPQGAEEELESEEQPERSTEGLKKAVDPVFVYLQATRSIPLLARQEEVEIAKGIEEG